MNVCIPVITMSYCFVTLFFLIFVLLRISILKEEIRLINFIEYASSIKQFFFIINMAIIIS